MTDALEVLDAKAETPKARERGSEERKVRQILDGARAVFLRDGFDGASMNDIAREAGVSKGTLYVYFPSKEALFAGYVRDDTRRQAERMVPYASDASLEEALIAIGSAFMRAMMSPSHIAQIRTVVAVAAKFPEIGSAFYEAGPLYGQERIARFLAARADDAGLDIENHDEAAIHYANLVQGLLMKRALFRGDVPTSDEIDASVREGVKRFLKLYARG